MQILKCCNSNRHFPYYRNEGRDMIFVLSCLLFDSYQARYYLTFCLQQGVMHMGLILDQLL